MGYAIGAAAGLAIRERIATQRLNGEHVAQWMHERGLKTSAQR
jgi:hypothetical protein